MDINQSDRFPIPLIEVTKLLKSIVSNFIKSRADNWDFDDLQEIAWIRALELADEFKLERNTKFSTFLCKYVKFTLLDYTRSGGNHHNPSRVCHASGKTTVIRSIYSKDTDFQLTANSEDAMAVNRGEDPDNILNKINLEELLQSVDRRERKILISYYGVGSTLAELAKRHRLSPERVRQIAVGGMMKLRVKNSINVKRDEFDRGKFFSSYQDSLKSIAASKTKFHKTAPPEFVLELFKEHGHGISMQDIREILDRDGYVLSDDRFWAIRKKAFPKVNFKPRFKRKVS